MSIRVLVSGRAWLAASLVVSALLFAGCADPGPEPPPVTRGGTKTKPATDSTAKVNVGQNIWLEVAGGRRRVLVSAEVCLRKGQLEQFMTRKGKKEHEAIVAADIDARKLHEALILAGAREGSPVQLFPRYRPATGTRVEVTVIYKDQGAQKVVNARSWVRNEKTGKELDTDWVFAGSRLVENPLDPTGPKQYLANEGDLICVSNFDSALLDVPILSSKDDMSRSYEAWTERIPPEGTRVVVALDPVLGARK